MNKSKIKTVFILIFCVCILAQAMMCFAQAEQFKASYPENRVRSFVHYFFSLFEKKPKDVDAIVALLAKDNLKMVYPWGQIHSKQEARKWITEIPKEVQDAHHIKNVKIEILEDGRYFVTLDVLWHNIGPEGHFQEKQLIYELELVDGGGRFPLIVSLLSKEAK
ncbi:MAG: nuclear transport factor 2 family protein [PVC group bacterium]|nr:nuclear transport factor 2 family protein [PVC group bacterium]